jgi:hypothetical protein
VKEEPIFIIGAARSGTNMLRDCLCKLERVKTWPCDEINYIWRHGNLFMDSDRFTKDQLTPKIQSYLIHEFDKIEKSQKAQFIVEKTCANSLRIPFIDGIFPKGKYICIIRDGYDVACSASKRWKASIDFQYIIAKAKYIPKIDFLYHTSTYGWNRIKKLFSKENRLSIWGPIYPGIHEDLKKYSLSEVSAIQWASCVETTLEDFKSISKQRIHYVKYESFVSNPFRKMVEIINFLELRHVDHAQIRTAIKGVSDTSVGNFKTSLTNDEFQKVLPIIEPIQHIIDNHFQLL